MNNNKVTVGQIALFLLIPGGKFLTLPSLLAGKVGNDGWIVISILFALDAVCLCFLAWALRRNTHNYSFKQVLELSCGKAVSKVVFLLFFAVMVMRVITQLSSTYKLFAVTFTVKTNWPLFVLPVMAVSLFAVSRGFNSIARTNQLLFVLVVTAVVSIMALPATQVKLADLLPIAESGWGKILTTALDNNFWFGDFMFILFLFGDVTEKKKVFAPLVSSLVIGAVVSVAMHVTFTLLYGALAPYSDLAMSKIGLFSVAESTNGRWDWLSLSVWVMSVFVKIFVYTFCAYRNAVYLFDVDESKFNYVIAVVITVLTFVPLLLPTEDILRYFLYVMHYPLVVLQYLLPVAMPLLVSIAYGRGEKCPTLSV